jgi:predicted acylesterase/phospholipase RssA
VYLRTSTYGWRFCAIPSKKLLSFEPPHHPVYPRRCVSMKLLAAAVVLGASTLSTAEAGQCTAVVIGGQGSQQAYVIGALQALTAAGAEYDVVVSTSASVLAAQAAASGATSKQWVAAAAKSVNSLTAASMYSDWPGTKVDGMTKHGGLYDSAPSALTYTKILSSPTGANSRTVVAIGTSLQTALQVPLPVTTSNVAQSVAGLLASATAPATYTPTVVTVNGEPQLFVSGDVRGEVNVFEAVAQCRARGAADNDITVDVVYTQASCLEVQDVSDDKTLAVQARGTAITDYTEATQDVLYARKAYPSVNIRYAVSPSFELLTDPTDYNIVARGVMTIRGKADANAAIAQVQKQTECDTTTAPACSQDMDCVSWAARACLSPKLATAARCLVKAPVCDNANGTSSGCARAKGKCSFNAEEVAEFHAAQLAESPEPNPTGTCLSVAFSGGGDRGAFEAGVLQGLVAGAPSPADVQYTASSGVSVGSIVSSGLAKFPVGQEATAAQFAVNTALSVQAATILKQWPNGGLRTLFTSGLLRGLLYESGIYDNSGLKGLLQSVFANVPLVPGETCVIPLLVRLVSTICVRFFFCRWCWWRASHRCCVMQSLNLH